jgi:NitT/TauT family transport system permease protein
MRKELLIGPLVILVIWFLLTSLGIISPLFLPSIPNLGKELYNQLILGKILPDIAATMYRAILGLILGSLIGVPVGILMGFSEKIYASMELVIDFSRSLPAMALFPLFLLFFGLGDTAKISIAFWATFLFMVINTIYGVKSCKETRIMVAKTMGASKLQIFVKVILPSSLPGIFAGVRVSISMALIVVVVSEMFMGTIYGLGQRIYNASLMYKIPEMYAAILVTGIIGYLLNKIAVLFEGKFIHWAGK